MYLSEQFSCRTFDIFISGSLNDDNEKQLSLKVGKWVPVDIVVRTVWVAYLLEIKQNYD